MSRESQDALLLFVGVMLLQVGITDLHLRYVKPEMQWFIIATGAVLAGLGATGAVRHYRQGDASDGVVTASPTEHVHGGAVAAAGGHTEEHSADDDGHGHSHLPRTAWLLTLPLLVMLLIAPAPLGAYAAARAPSPSLPEADDYEYPPLPAARDGAIDLSLTEYVLRSRYAPETLDGRQVRLTGFALPEDDGGWSVARIALSCCAADGRAITVRVLGAEAPPLDSWHEVVGSARPLEGEGDDAVAFIDATDVRPVAQPANAYE